MDFYLRKQKSLDYIRELVYIAGDLITLKIIAVSTRMAFEFGVHIVHIT